MGDTETNPESKAGVDKSLRDLISTSIGPQVEKGITDGIEQELEDVRHGRTNFFTGTKREKPGLLQIFLGLIFQVLEAFGLDKLVAGWFGIHIPEKEEIKDLSAQITKSVSTVMATRDDAGNLIATQLRPEELHTVVKEQVAHDISNNPALAAFSVKEIDKIANLAAAETVKPDRLEILKNLQPPSEKINTADVKLSGTPEQQVQQALEKISAGITGLAPGIKPSLVAVGTSVILNHKDLLDKPTALAEIYMAELEKDNNVRTALQDLSPDLIKSMKPFIRDRLASGIEQYKELLTKAVNGEATTSEMMAPATAPGIDIDATKKGIRSILAEKLKAETIDTVIATYNNSGAGGTLIRSATWLANKIPVNAISEMVPPKTAMETINNYVKDSTEKDPNYSMAKDSHIPDEVQKAKEVVYKWAVDNHYAPNDKQRERIAEVATNTAFRELGDANNRNLERPELANRLESAILIDLKNQQPSIDALGTSITDINHRPGPMKNTDTLGLVSKSLGDILHDPEKDKNGVFEMTKEIQKALLQKQGEEKKALLASASGAVDRNAGIGGAQPHNPDNLVLPKAGGPVVQGPHESVRGG